MRAAIKIHPIESQVTCSIEINALTPPTISSSCCRHYHYLTERTKIQLAAQKLPIIETNQELRDLMNEISIESAELSAITEICNEFLANGIELPKWSRGFNQTIPLLSSSHFEKLKIEYIRAKWV